MGVVNFYHLTQRGVDETARMLLDRALDQGWRVAVRGSDRAALERLDAALWLQPEDGFVPHGMAGGAHDAEQPVLIGAGAAVNGARAVLLMGAVAVDCAEAATVERVWLVFEGGDDAQLAHARTQWKAVRAAGLAAAYWSDAGGRWEKKAEAGDPA